MRTDLPHSLLWCTIYCSETAGAAGRQRAAAHLSAFLAGELDAAVIEGQQGSGSSSGSSNGSGGEEEADIEDEELHLDEYLQPPPMHRHWQPLLTFVTVPELPRG